MNYAAPLILVEVDTDEGITGIAEISAIADAAGVRICLHGMFESGISTCAASQLAGTLPNLDDGNQIMWQLLKEDLVQSLSLKPVKGALPISMKPGLGFELDWDAVGRAAEAHRKQA